MAVFNLFFATILLPLVGIAFLAIRHRRPLGGWIATFVLAAGLAGFSLLAAPWGWFGIPVRAVLALLFAAATILSLRRSPPPDVTPDNPARTLAKVLIGVFFGSVAIGVLRAHAVPAGAIDLGFPLRGGTYLIAHGGSTSAANIHARHPQQQYALDVVKLNRAGMRARGLYPAELTRYAIFGAPVVSPCDGTVVRAADAFPDHTPPMRDEKNAPGNHVVVRCGDADVWLAHLQRGSVRVRAGASVARGALLGRVGNSGNTTEPHLHVHAERDGRAVAARFDGRWLVRNGVTRASGPP
ncbi:MAG TPA: M23 family metallopeptidase [Thermoanaerobaculia bacterium]|nr:M23 family metallopeptidase [Thermoanaerobaculia bacterium]